MVRTSNPMSFMSGSGTGRARREYVLAGPSGHVCEEYEDLRSDRFERKGQKKKNRAISEDVVIAHYRGKNDPSSSLYPVNLSSIGFEKIRAFQNLEAYPFAFESDLDVLQWLCGMAAESPTARLLLKEAQLERWDIRLDDLSQGGYGIDDEAHTVLLDHFGFTAGALGRSAFFRNALFINFVKALRQLWHERSGHSFERTHRPDVALMLERARAADCETIAVLVGWELRGAGYSDVWRSILGSEEGDMAMIFTRAIEKDPAGFYDGSVLTRAFCQWYGDAGRVASCDHATLERMDAMLENAQGAKIFGDDPLRAADIEKLSVLPGGKAYLNGMGRNICTDPYFMALNDPINESHLFQVVYDSKIVLAGGVPFRDKRLARLIFPGEVAQTAE